MVEDVEVRLAQLGIELEKAKTETARVLNQGSTERWKIWLSDSVLISLSLVAIVTLSVGACCFGCYQTTSLDERLAPHGLKVLEGNIVPR